MKVTSSPASVLNQLDSSKVDKNATKSPLEKSDGLGSSSATKGLDNVGISNRAQQMKAAKEIASDDSIDEAKVAHFQNLIDSGKYNVDASAVADKMVDEHLLMADI